MPKIYARLEIFNLPDSIIAVMPIIVVVSVSVDLSATS